MQLPLVPTCEEAHILKGLASAFVRLRVWGGGANVMFVGQIKIHTYRYTHTHEHPTKSSAY